MTQTTLNINDVLMIVGDKRLRFPAPPEPKDLGAFLEDMLANGYTPEVVGTELRLTAPTVAVPPLPRTVSRNPNRPESLVSSIPTETAADPNSKTTPSNVVSLAAYRNAARSRDLLAIDCQGETA